MRYDSKETSSTHFQRQMRISHYDQWNQTDGRSKDEKKGKFFSLSLDLLIRFSLLIIQFRTSNRCKAISSPVVDVVCSLNMLHTLSLSVCNEKQHTSFFFLSCWHYDCLMMIVHLKPMTSFLPTLKILLTFRSLRTELET